MIEAEAGTGHETGGEMAGRLRAASEAAGMTQRQAADRLGVPAPQLSKWEHGVNRPGIDSLERLASAYGTTVPALTGHAEQATPAAADDARAAYARGRLDSALATLAAVAALVQAAQQDVATVLRSGALGVSTAAALPPPISPERAAELRDAAAPYLRAAAPPTAAPPASRARPAGRPRRAAGQ